MSVVSMTNKVSSTHQIKALQTQFVHLFSESQHQAYPNYASRLRDLNALQTFLIEKIPRLIQAIHQDFSERPEQETLLIDIIPTLQMLKYTQRHLKKWMKPEKRHAGLLFFPSSVEVHYQPLGVVGIVCPWNAPLTLSLIPLITAIAAGNRVMLKLSERTPHTNKVIKGVIKKVFAHNKVTVVEGDVLVSQTFCELPFDHLLFTGSTKVGKKVLAATVENLTPCTLELGGKSPVLIAPDCSVKRAAKRILFGKTLNAGQLCIAPDHVYVPDTQLETFVEALRARWQKQFPQGIEHADHTAIIDEKHFQHLISLIADASVKGATVIPLGQPEISMRSRKIALHLIINPSLNCQIMQEEIFGPILPIMTYHEPDQVIQTFKRQAKPLSLYVMSHDKAFIKRMITQTQSGNMGINDTVAQAGIEDAPFGGVGGSGMGSYHGKEGFLRLSHAKTVLKRGRLNPATWFSPPYNTWWQQMLLKYFLR